MLTVFDTLPTANSWIQVALAALNVVQTIALAYLAAERIRRNGS